MAGARKDTPPLTTSSWTLRPGIDGSFPFVKDHARAAAFHMAHVALQGVVDGSGGAPACLTVVSGQCCSLFDRTARDFAPGRFNNDMGSRDATRVQPDIICCCLVEGDHFILAAVLANQQREAIAALHL